MQDASACTRHGMRPVLTGGAHPDTPGAARSAVGCEGRSKARGACGRAAASCHASSVREAGSAARSVKPAPAACGTAAPSGAGEPRGCGGSETTACSALPPASARQPCSAPGSAAQARPVASSRPPDTPQPASSGRRGVSNANRGVLSRRPNAPGELNAAATGGGSAARGRHMASERVAESYDASYGAHGETVRPFPLPSFLASRTRRDVQQRRRA